MGLLVGTAVIGTKDTTQPRAHEGRFGVTALENPRPSVAVTLNPNDDDAVPASSKDHLLNHIHQPLEYCLSIPNSVIHGASNLLVFCNSGRWLHRHN